MILSAFPDEKDGMVKHFIQRTLQEISELSFLEISVLVSVILLFLPFTYSAAAILILLVFNIKRAHLWQAVKKQPGAKWLYALILLECAVSLIYRNWTGLINSLGLMLLAVYIAFYTSVINKKLFFYVIQLFLFLSLLTAVLAMIEFAMISARMGYSFLDFKIQNRPADRIHVMFYNANFYAAMLNFFIIFAVCSFIRAKRTISKVYFVFVMAVNFFCLVLTGCRTALILPVFYFPVFLWFTDRRRMFYIVVFLEAAAALFVSFQPSIIPRITDISTFTSRLQIWAGALQMIQLHPLFGMGPQTYGFYYEQIGSKKAPHAHNIYLDVLVSYGVVGTILFGGYLLTIFRKIYAVRKQKDLRYYLPMVICFVIYILLHGILDVTINFWQTGVVYMMILNSFPMGFEKRNSGKAL